MAAPVTEANGSEEVRGRTPVKFPNCHFLTISEAGASIYVLEKKEREPSPIEGDGWDSGSGSTSAAKATDTNNISSTKSSTAATTTYVHTARLVTRWEGIEVAEWSPQGDRLALLSKANAIDCIETSDWASKITIPVENAKRIVFSPKSSFLAVVSPYVPQTNEDNLKVYRIADKALVYSMPLKQWSDFTEPLPLMWSSNETFCFRKMPNEIRVYKGSLEDTEASICKIPAEKVKAFLPSTELPGGGVNVAVFIPCIKNYPASCKIFALATAESTAAICLNSKSFFQAQSVEFAWSPSGSGLLATSHVDVDTSGKSYYGSSCLYFLQAKLDGNSAHIVTSETGPVLAAEWSQAGEEFVVINGSSPADAKLYDGKTGDAKLSFGKIRRNTIRINRHGRFIVLAGFGNFNGDFEIWDKKGKAVVGQGKAECTVLCEWAPEGRTLLCATTTPRMRVDNCVKLLKYSGELLLKMDFAKLYSASWQPLPNVRFYDRAPSPGARIAPQQEAQKSTPAVYRPRNMTDDMRARLQASSRPVVVQTQATVIKTGQSAGPPGTQSTTVSKAALRSARKRANAAAAKAAGA